MSEVKLEAVSYSGETFEAVAPLGDELLTHDSSVDCEVCCPGSCTGCTKCNKCNLLF